jgi:small subunit ribosomal protein S29
VNLVNSTTPYEYDLRTRLYLQPTFSYQILQRLQTVNRAALVGLTTTKKLVFEKREVPGGTSLFDLVGVALKDPTSAPVILDALMSELSTQTKYASLFSHEYVRTDMAIF